MSGISTGRVPHRIYAKLFRDVDKALEQGGSSAPTLDYDGIAALAISGHRAARLNNAGLVIVASADLVGDAQTILGITINAAAPGGAVSIRGAGLIEEPSWNWAPELPIFCGPEGVLTQTYSASWAFSRILALALSRTSAWVAPQAPMML